MNANTNFDLVKPGDVIAFDNMDGWRQKYASKYEMHVIEKITPKQIILTMGRRVWKADGRIVGGNPFHKAFIPTQEQMEEHANSLAIRKRRVAVIEWFDRLRVRDLSVEQLEAMKEAFDRVTPEDRGA